MAERAGEVGRDEPRRRRSADSRRRERHTALLANVMRGTADEWARSFLRELRASGRAPGARQAPGRPARVAPGGPGGIARSEVASWRDAAQ
jgi:trehalose-6-phosphate synthase